MIQPKRVQEQIRMLEYKKQAEEKKMKAKRDNYANYFRNKLIRKATPTERRLRKELYLDGIEFVFQKIIPHGKSFFVVDFYFEHEDIKLAVELDGYYHMQKDGMVKDAKRSAKLRKKGIKVLRFPNSDIVKDPGYVIAAIKLKLGIFKHTE
jgi:very-short-patch-repair endonuclease